MKWAMCCLLKLQGDWWKNAAKAILLRALVGMNFVYSFKVAIWNKRQKSPIVFAMRWHLLL